MMSVEKLKTPETGVQQEILNPTRMLLSNSHLDSEMKRSAVDCMAAGKKLKKTPAPPSLPLRLQSMEVFPCRELSVEPMAAASLTNKEIAKILEAEAQDCARSLDLHLRLQLETGQPISWRGFISISLKMSLELTDE